MMAQDAIDKILEALDKHCDDPALECIKLGRVMVKVGEALRGKSHAEACAIIKSVQELLTIVHRAEPDDEEARTVPIPTPETE